jgi:hypothetical protein
MDDRVQQCRRVGRGERVASGQAAIRDRCERVEVGARVDALALRLLRRHVVRRADDVAVRERAGVRGQRCDAEIEDLPRAALAQHHVLRLEIAMHDPARGRGVDADRDLAA